MTCASILTGNKCLESITYYSGIDVAIILIFIYILMFLVYLYCIRPLAIKTERKVILKELKSIKDLDNSKVNVHDPFTAKIKYVRLINKLEEQTE